MAPSIKEIKKRLKDYKPDTMCWIGDQHMKISYGLTWLVLHTEMTANQLTSIGILVGVLAGLIMAMGQWWSFALGGLFFILHSLIDDSDSVVARYRKVMTFRGQYLSRFSHYIADTSLDIGLIIGVWNYTSFDYVLLIGFPMVLFGVLIDYAASSYSLALRLKGITDATSDKETKASFGNFIIQLNMLVFSHVYIQYWVILASILTIITNVNFLILLILIQTIGRFLKFFIAFLYYDKKAKKLGRND